MSKYLEHFEYDDLDHIARARMEHSVAMGNAIAGRLAWFWALAGA
jgi:hypothetical protein